MNFKILSVGILITDTEYRPGSSHKCIYCKALCESRNFFKGGVHGLKPLNDLV